MKPTWPPRFLRAAMARFYIVATHGACRHADVARTSGKQKGGARVPGGGTQFLLFHTSIKFAVLDRRTRMAFQSAFTNHQSAMETARLDPGTAGPSPSRHRPGPLPPRTA